MRRLHRRRQSPCTPARGPARPRGNTDRDRSRPDHRGAVPGACGRGSVRDAVHPRRLRHGPDRARSERLQADIVYMDLGMSSMQVDTWERGFSYAYDAPLDMRMDPDQELTAREIVNTWDERRLARVLRQYGEERYATQIGRAIVRTRRDEELTTTQQLVDTIKSAVPIPAQFAGGRPRSARSRRCGSPSTTSLLSSSRRCPRRGGCSPRAAGWPRSRSTRSRIASSSGSSSTARAAASARPSSRSASADTSPRRSCSRAAPSPQLRRDHLKPTIEIRALARRPQAGGLTTDDADRSNPCRAQGASRDVRVRLTPRLARGASRDEQVRAAH